MFVKKQVSLPIEYDETINYWNVMQGITEPLDKANRSEYSFAQTEYGNEYTFCAEEFNDILD